MWLNCMNPRTVIAPRCPVRGARCGKTVVYVAWILCALAVTSVVVGVAVLTMITTTATTDSYHLYQYATYKPRALDTRLTEDSADLEVSDVKVDFSSTQMTITQRKVDISLGQMDVSRTFKKHMFLVVGEQWQQVGARWQVCLSTQTSVDHLFWVAHQAQTWTGPLSVAVFAPDYDYSVAAAMIAFMQRCVAGVRQRTVFHLSYPTTLPPLLHDETRLLAETYTCDSDPEDVNKQLLQQLRPAGLSRILRKAAYPQNLLRNVARSGCGSDYTFTPDVDMIMVEGMASQLNHFVARSDVRKCTKCAYIVPVYEIHSNVSHNPTSKVQLLQLLEKELAQVFHSKVYKPNQENSQLPLWEKMDQVRLELDVAYQVSTWRRSWEPMYVAPADAPPYDERFKGYGYTRNSQTLEMNRAGFRWFMLNNAFLCHRGFQTLYTDPARISQILHNEMLFTNFEVEIWLRYSNSTGSLKTIGTIFVSFQVIFLFFICKNRNSIKIEPYKIVSS